MLIPREEGQVCATCRHSKMFPNHFMHVHTLSLYAALHSEDQQIGLNKLHHSLTAAQSGNLINDEIRRVAYGGAELINN